MSGQIEATCQGCGTVGPHRVVYAACNCRVWPLAWPEALARSGRCGACRASVGQLYDSETEAWEANFSDG